MNFQLTQSQQAVQQYSIEIRNQDRESKINTLRDKQRQRNLQESSKVTYDFKQFDFLIKQFQDQNIIDEMRFEILKPAIYFTDDDDNSHYAVKMLVEAYDVVYQLKEVVYNENIKLEYRCDSLLLLAQMMYSNYELCSELLKQGILELLIDLVKISFYHNNLTFLNHSLLGLANSITHEQKIRTIYIENQIDQLMLQILQKFQDQNIKKYIARIMNDWFRSKLENINIELFLQILNYILIIPSEDNYEYKENVIWFIYGFVSQVLDLNKETSDQFISQIIALPNLTNFLRQKINDKDQLGIVAGIRTITKIFRKVSDQNGLYDIFYDDLRLLFRNGQQYEVNLAKIEILKLMQVLHTHPKCSIFAEEFCSTQHYYFYNLKCQEYTLLGLEVCNIQIFNQSQLLVLLNLCKNILLIDLVGTTKLQSALAIIQKIVYQDNGFFQQLQDCIMIIEELLKKDNTLIFQYASNLIENYNQFIKQ